VKILVIGGKGYIGTSLVEELKKEHEIKVGTRKKEQENDIQINLLEKESLGEKIKDYDLIINLASVVRTIRKRKYEENIRGLKNLIEAVEETGQRMIYFSTINVNNKQLGPYSKSKKEAEELLRKSNISFMIVRPTLVYGRDKHNDIYKMIKIMKTLRIYPLLGNGKQRIEPLNKKDLAKSIRKIVKKFKPGKIEEIAGGEKISFQDLKSKIEKIIKKRTIAIKIPYKVLKISKILIPFDIEGIEEDKVSKKENKKSKHSIEEDIRIIVENEDSLD